MMLVVLDQLSGLVRPQPMSGRSRISLPLWNTGRRLETSGRTDLDHEQGGGSYERRLELKIARSSFWIAIKAVALAGVTMTYDNAWFHTLPESLRERAYLVGEESAWTRFDALSLIDWAERNNLKPLEIEVWLKTDSGPTIPGPYVWDSPTNESSSEQVNQRARESIRGFDWHRDDRNVRREEPYFNLTFD
jgi:hypothetical protein